MSFDITESLKAQERAKSLIPGMSQLLSKRPDMFTLGSWPAYYSKAKGAEVWDLDGNRYLDMSISGIGACVLGYADEYVDDAVLAAMRKGVASSLNCPEEVELAARLVDLHPWADMVRFGCAGGEAMSIAVRIARAATGRDIVAFCGYHGWHDWYLAANLSEDALSEHLISGLEPAGVPRGLTGTALPFRYNHIEELEQIVNKQGSNLAAIVMEPIRSHVPENGFLKKVRSIADKVGAVLVIDEISAGFRFCAGGAHLTLDLEPDMAVFSKALGNGYPISAVIGRRGVMEAAQSTFISSTNWTNRIGFAAALAVIERYEQLGLEKHLDRIGNGVRAAWRAASDKHGVPITVGGLVPLSYFAFPQDHANKKALFIDVMMDNGFLASNSFYAMGAHTNEMVEHYSIAADEAFGQIAAGNIEGRLRGAPAKMGFGRIA
jgi:glutamate-1-semialdehyde 2,1-aminomutase